MKDASRASHSPFSAVGVNVLIIFIFPSLNRCSLILPGVDNGYVQQSCPSIHTYVFSVSGSGACDLVYLWCS